MHDAQTPQESLDIALTATRKAHDAAALPAWAPIAAGVFGGLAGVLINDGWGNPPLAWIAGIASVLVCVVLVWWLSRARRARGVVPRPLAERPVAQWKQGLLLVLPPPVFAGVAGSGLDGWPLLVAGSILGGWIWFALARQRAARWKS
jgi:hypothetical protein